MRISVKPACWLLVWLVWCTLCGPSLAAEPQARGAQTEQDRLFAQILSDPADLEAQLKLARLHLSGGHYKAATARLEQVVLLAPQFLPARLMLAEAAFLSGNLTEARRIAGDLQSRALNNPDGLNSQQDSELESRASDLLGRIERAEKRSRIFAQWHLASGVSDNIAGAPAGNLAQAVIGGRVVTGQSGKRARLKTYHQGGLTLAYHYSFARWQDRRLELSLQSWQQDWPHYPPARIQALQLRASLTDSSGPPQNSRQHQIALQLDRTRQAGRPHASSFALQFEAQHPVSATSRAWISLSLQQRALHRPRAAGDKDSGLATSWLGRLEKNLSGVASGWLVEAGLGGSRLAAADRPQDRQGLFGLLGARRKLAGGVLGLGIEAGRQSWAAPHPAYQLAAKRRDRHQSLRLAWQRILSSAPQPPRLLLSASSSKNRSNILNFSRVENRLSLRLSVPFWAR